ncbi:hypothetical protein D9619_002641 [Psilocybe cf. subviscida]|uniref:non-specific serine/threonine protein kinase n=1 Tax=Psilocybe cf. subviscida TaxID=2480587 RepID=A0A8H5AZV9_9AGAR|nr:hypothetical protein D9619_002641 [Psilocybe cf. subviscida]
MASQQAFQAYPNNKGTLVPGQTINVNNYTVSVERYLSQGGFAHVYLVRTPTPVYNTTHHVLKRIAVANEAMLKDVKKEVDIMRLLKGHPNIVHLIDAAWHKLPNGTFEVFILMEFCPGGGIIDMMNRRLRERLTEAEILQIFVDVCEGVAYMHNSRPPLLHRDLKVENILQSSPTSFKLCDFGSATTVAPAPTTTQEIRALEADLNRHTTLQYRAPEMVDVYSKRPVNEKSDVWALGVLLFKLCYYTTPFEEHGPLAILNVQYRIPPYPVYSQDMNTLIASMLREHGAQRPTVFELLNHVHRLRGSKSKFTYNIPVPPPLLPRTQPHAKVTSPPNPLDGIVTYGAPAPTAKPAISIYHDPKAANVALPNQGIQARDKVLEAIAPMRRGRPNASGHQAQASSSSRPSSPQKNHARPPPPMNLDADNFVIDKDVSWKSATEHPPAARTQMPNNDAWNLGQLDRGAANNKARAQTQVDGFGDDFAQKLWKAPDPNANNAALAPRLSPRPAKKPLEGGAGAAVPGLAFTGAGHYRPKADRIIQAREAKDKDAFEGLGLMTNAPRAAPTLGEARKLRTGLATMSTPAQAGHSGGDYLQSGGAYRPSPSPQPRYLSTSPLNPKSVSPVPTPGSSTGASYKNPMRSGSLATPPAVNGTGTGSGDGPIESRFPSLEDLETQFSPPIPSANALYPSSVNEASNRYTASSASLPARQDSGVPGPYSAGRMRTQGTATGNGGAGHLLKPTLPSNPSAYAVEGVRSQQVTGSAMKEQKQTRYAEMTPNVNFNRSPVPTPTLPPASAPVSSPPAAYSGASGRADLVPRPLVVRKRGSSASMRPDTHPTSQSSASSTAPTAADFPIPPKLPPRPPTSSSALSPTPAAGPARDWLTGDDEDNMRSMAAMDREDPYPDLPVLRDSPRKRASFDARIVSGGTAQYGLAAEQAAVVVDEQIPQSPVDLSPTVSRFKRAFPAVERFDGTQSAGTTTTTTASMDGPLKLSWSPLKRERLLDVDSSGDEGPEEASSRLVPQGQASGRPGHKARQSSVHDLVYQYGGGLMSRDKEKEKPRDREREMEREREREAERARLEEQEWERERAREKERERQMEADLALEREMERAREEEREKEREREIERVQAREREARKEKEPERRTPAGRRSRQSMQFNIGPSDYIPTTKPKPSGLSAPPKREEPRTGNASLPPASSPARPPVAAKPQATRPLPAAIDTAKASSRSRPQSMFLFPSKSTDSPPITASQSLAPPQQVNTRPTRRTSISDMVQRYESISGNVTSPLASPLSPGPPSPVHRPVSTKVHVENGRAPKTFPEQLKPATSSKPSTSSRSNTPVGRTAGDPIKTRSPMKDPIRQNTGVMRSVSGVHKKSVTERNIPAFSSQQQAPDISTTRPRRISAVKPAAGSTPSVHVRSESLAPRTAPKPAPVNIFANNASPRKPPISLVDEAPKTEEPPLSSSPEKPYQGVGKLIDQWQKKSAEAEGARVGKGYRV